MTTTPSTPVEIAAKAWAEHPTTGAASYYEMSEHRRDLLTTRMGHVIAAPDYEHLLQPALPAGVRRLIWVRGNATPSGARVRSTYEIVLVKIPEGRAAYGAGLAVDDVLVAGVENRHRFAGAKPAAWTRWVLAALGYQPGVDDLEDLFRGSGAVASAVNGLLTLPDPVSAPPVHPELHLNPIS